MKRLVVVGNGMAGFACLQQILQRPHDFEITVFGDEPRANYDRNVLASVLAGLKSPDEIALNDWNWYQDNGILTRLGVHVVRLDPARRLVIDEDGGATEYDRLILAMGARPWLPPIAGLNLDNVYTLRTLDDAGLMLQRLRPGLRTTVIGGGVQGVETACALRLQGCEVTLVQLAGRLLEHHLDAAASAYVQHKLEALGVRVMLGAETQSLSGRGSVETVRLPSGLLIPAEIVVIATGVQPDVELARQAGLNVRRGVLVNDYLETSAPGIFAAGGCTEHRGQTYCWGEAILEQAGVLAAAITGNSGPAFTGAAPVTKLSLAGIDILSAGSVDEIAPGVEILQYDDPLRGAYKKLFLKDNRLVGVILAGEVSDEQRYRDWLSGGADLSELHPVLLSPRPLEETAAT